MTPDIKTRGWDAKHVKAFVKDAISFHKAAWDVVPSLRRAILAERFADIIRHQDRDQIPAAYLDNLWIDMCECAKQYGFDAEA